MPWEKNLRTKPTKLRLLRIFTQALSLFFFNLAIFNFAQTWLILPVEAPQTPWSTSEGAFYVMQHMLTTGLIPFIPLAIFFIIGGLVGRAFCGWFCPFGLVQDLVGFVPTEKYEPTEESNRDGRHIGEFFTAVFVIIAAFIGSQMLFADPEATIQGFGDFVTDPYSAISPVVTVFLTLPLYIIHGGWPLTIEGILDEHLLFWMRILILLVVLFITLYIPRSYCRYFCPTGMIMGRIGKHSLIGISVDPIKCTDCGKCEDVCPMGVRILDNLDDANHLRSEACIMCMDCVFSCEEDGAISLKIRL